MISASLYHSYFIDELSETMFKLTLFLIAVGVAAVACNPVVDEDATDDLTFFKKECSRSINKASTELANLYRKLKIKEMSYSRQAVLFNVYSREVNGFNNLLKEVREAKSMQLVENITTHGGLQINCRRDIAEKVKDVTKYVNDVYQEILSCEKSAACNPVVDKDAVKKLESAKQECSQSMETTIHELYNLYCKLDVKIIGKDKYGVLSKIYGREVQGLKDLLKEVGAAKSMQLVKDIKTPGGLQINCSKDIAEKVKSVTEYVYDIYQKILSC